MRQGLSGGEGTGNPGTRAPCLGALARGLRRRGRAGGVGLLAGPGLGLCVGLCLGLAGLQSMPAWAADEPAPPTSIEEAPKLQQVLGLSLQYAPLRGDAGVRRWSLHPAWAARYGRFRAGSSRFGSLFGSAADAGSGASALLVDDPHWRAGIGLRLDNGQSSGAAASGAVTREVQRTVRVRGYLSLQPSADWSLGVAGTQDMLGRGGGMVLSVDVGRALPEWPGERWGASAGLTWGDARYVGGRHGTLASPGRAAYAPGAGWVDAHLGVGANWPLGARWMVWCQAGLSRLLGPAADSPASGRLLTGELQAGAAWRWY